MEVVNSRRWFGVYVFRTLYPVRSVAFSGLFDPQS
jgi:hypothetical protein